MVKVFATIVHSEHYHTAASFKPEETDKIGFFLWENDAIGTKEEMRKAAEWAKTAWPGMVMSGENWELEIDEIWEEVKE